METKKIEFVQGVLVFRAENKRLRFKLSALSFVPDPANTGGGMY